MRLERTRGAGWSELIDLEIDPESKTPLFRQIYLGIRQAVLSGQIRSGNRLPSTRSLANRLAVSRTSVIAAYEQLLVEGYIEGRLGSGTYVSEDLTEIEDTTKVRLVQPASRSFRSLSDRGRRIEAASQDIPRSPNVPFNTGVCGTDARTLDVLRQLGYRILPTLAEDHRGYADPQGSIELRTALAEYLRAARAVRCTPDQITIVSGAQQAIDLCVRILVDPRDTFLVEDPCYPYLKASIVAAGSRVVPVPVDGEGVNVGVGIRKAGTPRAIYVTPSHQYPMGVTLSMARRLELLTWADTAQAWIVEDDYDSEFRYDGRPLASLQGLDDSGRVIYIGSLSKVLLPGLRLGYVVVPQSLIGPFVAARLLADRHPPILQQRLLEDFLSNGFFTSHIRRMRLHYGEMRILLADLLKDRLGSLLDVSVPKQGMHLIAKLRDQKTSDVAVAQAAAARGVVVKAVSRMFLSATPVQALMLGFTGFSPHEMRGAVGKLEKAFAGL